MPQPPLTLPAACGSVRELAIPENAVTGVPPVPTYRTELEVEGNTRVSACATEGVADGQDAAVRFTAPSGGRWRLTAHGIGLRTLSALHGCEIESACTAFDQYEGPHVAPTLTLDLFAQRDETYAIVLDGCDTRTCSYTLTAARIGPLECPPPTATLPLCDAETTRCAIDPCDAERFVCEPKPPDAYDGHPIDAATVLLDPTEAIALLSVRLRDLPTGPYEGHVFLFYEWLAADGSELVPDAPGAMYVDGEAEDGAMAPRLVYFVPPGAARVRLWAGLAEDARAGAIEVGIGMWNRGGAGEACEVATLSATCERGHRCVAAGAGPTGTCVRSERLEITQAEAYYAPRVPSFRLHVAGLTPGEYVSALRVELLDASGTSLIELPLVHLVGGGDDLATATFDATTAIEQWELDPALMARAASLRMRAVTVEATESAPRDVRIARATELESGASCAEPSVACGEALSCVLRTAGSFCEPTVEPGPCYLDGHTARWAPPGSGTYTIEGVPRDWGGFTSCAATRTMSPAEALFIAPVTGHYVFDTAGLYSFEVMPTCEMPACVSEEPRVHVEVDLEAGARIPVRFLSDRKSAERFSVRVVVP